MKNLNTMVRRLVGSGFALALLGATVAFAAGGVVKSTTGEAPDRYVYYPGTEELQKDEIRLISCGTGLPAARRSQAATCWLAEAGNGDKFLFDIGTGSMVNVAALMIPYDYLDKVFLTHLHTDHWGDLSTLWAGGWTAGRTGPLKIWGPSGATADMGTKYAVEHFLKSFTWDARTRDYALSAEPGKISVIEFDYKAENKIVYQENGVTIRSIPAIHAGDGAVSFIMEYAGLKVVIGGDTFPNKWYIKYAKNADVAIHETFLTPSQLVELYGQSPGQALGVGTRVHTAPPAFGKVMSEIKPRLAIGYHFFNDADTRYGIYDGVRQTYSGPLTLATDNMVWNITKEEIKVRDIVSPDQAWGVPGPNKVPSPPAKGTVPDPITDYIREGKWNVDDALKPMVTEFKKEHHMK
ncbi:guanitoxin biosynthesis MBL fold metallo-hydrolase GntH [Sulfurovum sp. CS9]|uniref:guanitoxin biosynthesis MBL fold metallo-hydrolase GntH n=1 Tax=Sulfurovum sp. CS9 TaxID=3391146 RepID=UPI0039ED7D41